jgi:anti-sigma factor RsiW
MKQTRDQLEYAISQYIDGTLPPLESAALDERLAVDVEARDILAEYRALDQTLKTSLPTPAVAWDRLHAHLSDAVSREEAPVRHYSMRTYVRVAAVALAASVAVVFGVILLSSNRTGPGSGKLQPIAIVVGPQVETASQQVASVTEVSIGPAPTMSDSWRYAETVVARPAVVMIDRAARPAQDGDLSPF